jgi:hypothetical protein
LAGLRSLESLGSLEGLGTLESLGSLKSLASVGADARSFSSLSSLAGVAHSMRGVAEAGRAVAGVAPGLPFAAAQLPISTGSSVMSAETYGRVSPTTSACETYFDVFSSFSMFCGATFLPPAVTRMSFLRSVMWRRR